MLHRCPFLSMLMGRDNNTENMHHTHSTHTRTIGGTLAKMLPHSVWASVTLPDRHAVCSLTVWHIILTDIRPSVHTHRTNEEKIQQFDLLAGIWLHQWIVTCCLRRDTALHFLIVALLYYLYKWWFRYTDHWKPCDLLCIMNHLVIYIHSILGTY